MHRSAPCASRSGRRSATTTSSSRSASSRSSSRRRASARSARPTPASAPTASCCSSRPTSAASWPSLRIFNPDGSEAELSGNGAREAVLYLRRNGWTDADTFSIRTAAGEIRPHITGPDTCTRGHGPRAARAPSDFPSGGDDGTGVLEAAGREFALPARAGRQPAVRDRGGRRARGARPRALGAAIERHELFPNRTNVSFWRARRASEIRARIFERGVGETMSSGTGASGAAVAAVLRGGDSPVTVRLDGGELEVEVGEDLHVDLTGWARARVPRRADRRLRGGARVRPSSAWTGSRRTCSPSSSARSPRRRPRAWT